MGGLAVEVLHKRPRMGRPLRIERAMYNERYTALHLDAGLAQGAGQSLVHTCVCGVHAPK